MNEKSIIPSLLKFCRKLGIEENIIFTGLVPLDEVRTWLNKCSILAITRPNIVQTVAGFPTKIGEYFACRKTVLSTRIGDVSQYFGDRKEIVFAEPDNPVSIAENIEWILNNPEAGRTIAENGYNRAMELLSYKVRVPAMLGFINGFQD